VSSISVLFCDPCRPLDSLCSSAICTNFSIAKRETSADEIMPARLARRTAITMNFTVLPRANSPGCRSDENACDYNFRLTDCGWRRFGAYEQRLQDRPPFLVRPRTLSRFPLESLKIQQPRHSSLDAVFVPVCLIQPRQRRWGFFCHWRTPTLVTPHFRASLIVAGVLLGAPRLRTSGSIRSTGFPAPPVRKTLVGSADFRAVFAIDFKAGQYGSVRK
jgi:hypothetical protein